jgi:mediator of RNA polymerase II transcription subunit 13, fungi type
MGCRLVTSCTNSVCSPAPSLLALSLNLFNRPLIHCDLQIHLSYTRLTIRPILRPTPYMSLSLCLPLPPGTPISLLPHSTPAYFLANYTGPTSALATQFDQSLVGMGAGNWKTSSLPSEQRTNDVSDLDNRDPAFIIAWIKVQNKQGEEKGVTVIWPKRLCLSFIPGHPKSRQLLDYIPELPAQLQPSHPPAISPSSPQRYESTVPSGRFPFAKSMMRRVHSSPTSDSLRVFRTLLIGKGKDINGVAVEVGGYVDAVARERERERERMKKEREIANSPKLLAGSKATLRLQDNPRHHIHRHSLCLQPDKIRPLILVNIFTLHRLNQMPLKAHLPP